MKAGRAIADFGAGAHLYAVILTALFDRSRTGHGQIIDVAMQEAVVPTSASSLA